LSLGVSPQAIEQALANSYNQQQVSTIYTQNNQYMVVMELLPQFQQDVNALRMLYVRSAKGDLVPLSAVATITQGVGPLSITHAGQLPAVTIAFNTKPGVALGQATAAVEAAAALTVPSSVTMSFSGTAQAFQASQQGLLALLILAIFVIYMVLGILYESFIHPATILTGLPFAAGKEERDHDDRLRARGGKNPAHHARKSDRARGEREIPSNHDDDVRRIDGDASYRAWHWGWRGGTSSPGRRRRWWAGVFPAGDLVRDSGLLHLLRRAARARARIHKPREIEDSRTESPLASAQRALASGSLSAGWRAVQDCSLAANDPNVGS